MCVQMERIQAGQQASRLRAEVGVEVAMARARWEGTSLGKTGGSHSDHKERLSPHWPA